MDWSSYNAGRNRGRAEVIKKERGPAVSCRKCKYAEIYETKGGIQIIGCNGSIIYIASGLIDRMEIRCADYDKGKPVIMNQIIEIRKVEE